MTYPWDETGETELEYCRRVVRENEPQTHKVQVWEETTELVIAWTHLLNWRPLPGIKTTGYPGGPCVVTRVTPHPTIKDLEIVWVRRI